MRVGDYVRVKDYQDIQHIIKIEKIIDNYTIFSKRGYWSTENIIKSSPNIIDLIEVGDYVNGHRVLDVYKDINGQLRTSSYYDGYICNLCSENEIKSIVTKEQLEAMKYEIK